jgi:O-methyltransferase involved in polyketide biosynthesis
VGRAAKLSLGELQRRTSGLTGENGGRVEGKPSQTALVTAAARAAHLIVDRPPWIFEDTLAEALVGDAGGDLIALHRQDPTAPRLASLRVAM